MLCSGQILDKTLGITQKTSQVYADFLAIEERVRKQNVTSNLQKVDELRKELACF